MYPFSTRTHCMLRCWRSVPRAGYRTAGREPNLPGQRCPFRARGHGPCASRSQMGLVGLPGAPGSVPQCIDELMFSGALEVPLGHPGSPNSYPRSLSYLIYLPDRPNERTDRADCSLPPPASSVSHIISSLHRRLVFFTHPTSVWPLSTSARESASERGL